MIVFQCLEIILHRKVSKKDFLVTKGTQKVSERVGNNGIERRNTRTSPLWITPLRMLLKKKSDKKMFDRISMLRDHTAPKGM